MTPETRSEIEKFDAWLAIQDVTGRRFFVGYGGVCTLISYQQEEYAAEAFTNCMSRIFGSHNACLLFDANDQNHGDPAAVRAKLHELYPFLTETPERSSPAPTHAQGNG